MQEKMEKAVELFSKSIFGIRYGNVSAGLIDTIRVPIYGQMSPIKHIAMTGKQGNTVFVDLYDSLHINVTLKVLTDAGFSAHLFSKNRIIISVPPPSGEQREEIILHVKSLSEDCKISIRNIRKKYRQQLEKTEQKDQDELIQKLTDKFILEVENLTKDKIESIRRS